MSVKKADENNYNKAFPSRLRALLDNENQISPLGKKVTQVELAQAFHDNGIPVTRQTISLYANGNTTPDIEKFKFIADYFKVSYDFLLGVSEATSRDNVQINKELGLSEKAINELKKIKDMGKDGQAMPRDINFIFQTIDFLISENWFFIVSPVARYALTLSKIKKEVRNEEEKGKKLYVDSYKLPTELSPHLRFIEWEMVEMIRDTTKKLAEKLSDKFDTDGLQEKIDSDLNQWL